MKNDNSFVYFVAFLLIALLLWVFACTIIGGGFILHYFFNLPVFIGASISLVADFIVLCIFYSLEEE